jgi:hypothetical protein
VQCQTARPWTPSRARQWWEENADLLTARESASTRTQAV